MPAGSTQPSKNEARIKMLPMSNRRHLAILERGVKSWNRWRHEESRKEVLNQERADLIGATLRGRDLTGADLSNALLNETD